MKIAGQATVEAAPEAIWPLLFDPRTLLQLLPGCEAIEQLSADEYRARLTLPVPAVAGVYDARVKIVEHGAPHFCRLEGEASGAAGIVKGEARFTLAPEGDGARIAYEADALIGGSLASMNPRFAEGVAQSLIKQGLARLPELIREQAAMAAPLTLPAEGPAVAPAPPRRSASLGMLLAALWAGFLAWLLDVPRRLRVRP